MTESHWCVIHKTPFFKKGAMKAYAHPIKDENGETTGWCNEPKGQTKEKQWGGKSPEEIKSIETQVAAKICADLLIANKLDSLDPNLTSALTFWLFTHLEQSITVKPTATAVKDTAKEPEYPPEPVLIPGIISDDELITAEQKERLKELQEKLPGRALQLIKEWGWDVRAISKLTKRQAKHLIDVLVAETVIKEGSKE